MIQTHFDTNPDALMPGISLIFIPAANPDGLMRGREIDSRFNANGVDLNRNLPSQDWIPEVLNPRYPPGPAAGSELENQLLVQLIETLQPRAIFSIHSAFTDRCINVNGINGSAQGKSESPVDKIAQAMADHSGYPITTDIGYPTPGSLGTWAGHERGIPTITLEIPRGQDPDWVWREHGKALWAGLRQAFDCAVRLETP
ncbi:MAG: murein peptide amidase A [Synechococcaceae cyanobacterium RM1_1_27]|nr:murein peptide amidase A [Synechococcaceae cyanobacterium RM1_1_27]